MVEYTENSEEGSAETEALPPDQQPEGGVDVATPKSTKSPAFQFYSKDFLSDELQTLLSLPEAGSYIRLLAHCWQSGSLPNDTAALARLCGATPKQMARMWPAVSRCFQQRSDGRWTHKRLDQERRKQIEYRRRQQDAAAMRWHRPGISDGNALQSASASASSSAIASTVGSATLHQSHRSHAACGRVCVPGQLHAQFVRALNRDAADVELRTWYSAVNQQWTTGPHKDDNPGGSDYAFWRARFDERWPAAKKVPDSRLPAWAIAAKAGQA